jgi:hypothetical protein
LLVIGGKSDKNLTSSPDLNPREGEMGWRGKREEGKDEGLGL